MEEEAASRSRRALQPRCWNSHDCVSSSAAYQMVRVITGDNVDLTRLLIHTTQTSASTLVPQTPAMAAAPYHAQARG
uniref:Uncharacterized protein n=1 Tax=Arundo donax TaxID=35708 RepID=A0A0A9ALL2_ARUDO